MYVCVGVCMYVCVYVCMKSERSQNRLVGMKVWFCPISNIYMYGVYVRMYVCVLALAFLSRLKLPFPSLSNDDHAG